MQANDVAVQWAGRVNAPCDAQLVVRGVARAIDLAAPGNQCPGEYAISKDGRYFAYYRNLQPRDQYPADRDFVLLDTERRTTRTLATNVGSSTATHFPVHPIWSPSGRYVQFQIRTASPARVVQWTLDIQTGQAKEQTSDPGYWIREGRDILVTNRRDGTGGGYEFTFTAFDVASGTKREVARFATGEVFNWFSIGPDLIEIAD
jgi:hypothetical protein